VLRLWEPSSLTAWARETASEHGCTLVIKMGEQGSLVCEREGALWQVPAYPSAVVDTTGAGDAFCGGFLAGLVAGASIPECAAMGTVSASYVVEARGALATERPTPPARHERLGHVLKGTRKDA
jgi:sugar/nucleoside kinase (ribokinase family)